MKEMARGRRTLDVGRFILERRRLHTSRSLPFFMQAISLALQYNDALYYNASGLAYYKEEGQRGAKRCRLENGERTARRIMTKKHKRNTMISWVEKNIVLEWLEKETSRVGRKVANNNNNNSSILATRLLQLHQQANTPSTMPSLYSIHACS